MGCEHEALEKVDQYPQATDKIMNLYQTVGGIYGELNELGRKNVGKIELYQLSSLSEENRPIPMVRLKSHELKDPVSFLFVAGTHGDEAIGVEVMISTIQRFVEENTIQSKNLIIDFIPMHNPDGYAENERENSHGVDLNRNFPFATGSDHLESETKALVNLINTHAYNASLFFHSANEEKYNNLIRCPLEFRKMGLAAFEEPVRARMQNTIELIKQGAQKEATTVEWSVRSDLVNAPGIASDWCTSGFLTGPVHGLISETCKSPHPSLTIEMTFPKQPLDPQIIAKEKEEMYQIIYYLVNNY